MWRRRRSGRAVRRTGPRSEASATVKTEVVTMARKIISEYGQAVFNLPWLVAQEEGLFAEEGLEVEFVRGRERDPQLAAETNPQQVHPFWRHAPFEERTAQVFNACEWG